MSTLEKIYESTLKFLSPLSLEETYKIIIDEAVNLVKGTNGRLFLVNDNGELKSVYDSSDSMPLRIPRKKGNIYKSFSEKKAFIVHNKYVTRNYPDLREVGVKSIMYIPLTNEDISYGVITVRSTKDKEFTLEELNVLKIFGSLATLAIRKAQSYDEAKKASDVRDLFISLAAHELRTPITTINGYIQLILVKLRDKKKVDPKWIYELAFETNRLKNLINEFLEINRIRTGKVQYDFREISLGSVIEKAISDFSFTNPGRKVVFRNKLNSHRSKIIGDMERLLQVIINILENAAKYSPEDKKIVVETKYNSPYYTISINDQGQGIKEKDLPLVFRGFYKGENSLHEGMGLGLYLAKRIIEKHNGEIEIRSKFNRGTKVIIKLPKSE